MIRRLFRHTALDPLLLAGVFLVTLVLETALVERKFSIFAGGYGQSRIIDTPLEWLAFILLLLLSHFILIAAIFLLIRKLHGRGADPVLFRYNFLFLALVVYAALLFARFEVLGYFSDAMSFQLVRTLGGGSLVEALLFVLSEGVLLLVVAALGLAAYIIGFWLIKRRKLKTKQMSDLALGRPLLLLTIILPFLMLSANCLPDARYALTRYTAYGLFNDIFGTLTDFDRDGYGWFTAQIDHYPFDANRHPLALDIPGNGIDEDGFGGDLILAPAAPATPMPILPQHPKNVIIIVLESVRGDVLGKRIHGRVVAPNLEQMAREGTAVPDAYSHVGYTIASLKSLFSGQLDPRPGDPSLFSDLKSYGYKVGIFSGQPESFGDISATVAMQASSNVFVDAETLKTERAFGSAAKGSIRVDESKLLREFDRYYGRHEDWSQPNFLYFNFQSPHFPYYHDGMPKMLPITPLPRNEITLDNRDRVAETYWNSVAYADMRLGQLIARLKSLGVWQNSLVIVTADHGESLFDDNFLGHGHAINHQQTHIPLVMNIPGLNITQPIGLDDYRGIILSLLAGEKPHGTGAPVFQHIGEINAPAAIGMVESGGRFTTMRLDTEEIWFSDLDKKQLYSDLTPSQKLRADRLITLWGQQRWLGRSR